VSALKKKMLQITTAKEELLVDLNLHNIPAKLLKEFASQVVRPYYFGSLSQAIRDLMQNAVADQEFLQNHVEPL
jgi:tagatose-1,6-bisphosphate aldolase non-catalytic subunit AgaZ/GatZ